MTKGLCIWITGLSGAGKTTLAKAFIAALGRPVTYLEGYQLRQTLWSDLGYSQADRDLNVARIGFIANELVKAGNIVVVDAASPHRKARDKARELIGEFIEVYLDTPETVRPQRVTPCEYERGNPDFRFIDGTPDANAVDVINGLVKLGYLGIGLLPGRFQGAFHAGHKALFKEALKEGFVRIAVRRAVRDKLNFTQVKANIDRQLREYVGRYDVVQLDFDNIFYSRGVGYGITRIEHSEEAVSASQIRESNG